MKRFIFCLVLAVVLIGTFLRYLTVKGLPYPLGVELVPMVIIGFSGFLAAIGTVLSISGAIHDFIMARRRRKWHEGCPKSGMMGTTTTLLSVAN